MFNVDEIKTRHTFYDRGQVIVGISLFLKFSIEKVHTAYGFFDSLPRRMQSNQAEIRIEDGGILIKDDIAGKELFFCIQKLGIDRGKFVELQQLLQQSVPRYNINKSAKSEIQVSVWTSVQRA